MFQFIRVLIKFQYRHNENAHCRQVRQFSNLKCIIYNLFHPILESLCSVWIWTKIAINGRDILVIEKDMHQIQVDINMSNFGSESRLCNGLSMTTQNTNQTWQNFSHWQTTPLYLASSSISIVKIRWQNHTSLNRVILGPFNYTDCLEQVRCAPCIKVIVILRQCAPYLPLL